MKQALTINSTDNLAVALVDLPKGTLVEINGEKYELLDDILAKHKFALRDFSEGEELFMYGLVVGTALTSIQKGSAVTIQNVAHKATEYDLDKQQKFIWNAPNVSKYGKKTFMGYYRADGQVGTANYWLVFPLVFCENRNIEVLRKAFERALGYEQESRYESMVQGLVHDYQNGTLNATATEEKALITADSMPKPVFENVEVRFITHQGGCGGIRQDAETLCRLLAGYVNNPNVAGATVLSLGCQNAEIKIFKEALRAVNGQLNKLVVILDQQSVGKENTLIATAIKETFNGLIEANKLKRKPAPLSKLSIGLECGGSDGFSGISANPSIGYTSDLVAALGGRVMLAEFPELCGVEQELINRMPSRVLAEKFTSLMRAYEKAAEDSGSGFDMNPSPGNIKDGLITDAMKSAGAAKKGGTSPVNDILDYTEYLKKDGLSLLCTPGNDVESTTGLAGSGANIILFTTGLGTPTGNPITPVIKLSSNTKMAERMDDIIDINTGPVVEGKKSIEEMGEEVLEFIIAVASGEVQTKGMKLRQFDFIPWKRGVSL